jgi:hypothetical protein
MNEFFNPIVDEMLDSSGVFLTDKPASKKTMISYLNHIFKKFASLYKVYGMKISNEDQAKALYQKYKSQIDAMRDEGEPENPNHPVEDNNNPINRYYMEHYGWDGIIYKIQKQLAVDVIENAERAARYGRRGQNPNAMTFEKFLGIKPPGAETTILDELENSVDEDALVDEYI